MGLKLKESIEQPLYDLWRIGMVVPACFAAAFFIIHHMVLGGDAINRRSWYAFAGGACFAVLSLLPSCRLMPRLKVLYVAITIVAYPLLFVGAMLIG